MLEFIRSTYFQGLLNSFSAGVVIFNSEGLVYAVNESAYSILDLEMGEQFRKLWVELFAGFEQKEPLKEITWEVETEPCELLADCRELSMGIAEIFANSIESIAASRGAIKVYGSMHEGIYLLEITDTGKGIHPGNLQFVFDPFFTTKTVGVGMGLCKAEKTIKDHEGSIVVRNADGGGTTVSIEFKLPKYTGLTA